MSAASPEILAMDLGGTKLLLARIDHGGKIIEKKKVSVQLSEGPEGLLQQISQAAIPFKTPKTEAVALSSAGPLDPEKGLWLNPTNLKTDGLSWGNVKVVEYLQSRLELPCFLENDAACAALAEAWVGQGKGCKNFIAVTLGTGVGVGVWANGGLVRSGRNLHTELGHLIIDSGVGAVLCGCGNRGCAEAYLSGANFSKIASQILGHEVTGELLLDKARAGDNKALRCFEDYSYRLALFLRNLIVTFYPEKIILSGGFSVAAEFFLPRAEELLKTRMSERAELSFMPELVLSNIQNEMGALGAAHLAFNKLKSN